MSSEFDRGTFTSFNLVEKNNFNKAILKDISLLDLSGDQVRHFEHTKNVEFTYEPGLIGVSFVPYYKIEGSINPIQVLEQPLAKTDALPKNRAIAKIGEVTKYWELLSSAAKSTKFNFFRLESFNLLPVYINKEGHSHVNKGKIEWWHRDYGKTPYPEYIRMINFGGDSDFVGSYEAPKRIPVYMPDHTRIFVPYSDVGVRSESVNKVFEFAKLVYKSHANEITKIIKSKKQSYPAEVIRAIDITLSNEDTLHPVNIVRSNILHADASREFLEKLMSFLQQNVNKEFSKNIKNSPTVNAVHNLHSALEKEYQEALPNYKF